MTDSTKPSGTTGGARRRSVLLTGAGLAAGAVAMPWVRRVSAADQPTVVNSIRSLTNPYHATWNKGGEAFAKAMGAPYTTLVTEGNSEKCVADVRAMLAKTGGNMVLNVDPNDSPDARPIVEACHKAGAYVVTQWNKPADLHPWDFDPNYVAHVSFNGVPNGKAMAEALFKAMGGEGGIVALGGILSNIPAIERKRGLDQALAENPKIKLLDVQVANWVQTEALEALGDGRTAVVISQRNVPETMRRPEARAGFLTSLDKLEEHLARSTQPT